MATQAKVKHSVKDAGVATALRKALADDGKLSYQEVLSIIYSACDEDDFSGQEIQDINGILANSPSVQADPKLIELKNQFKANPDAFLKYRGFSSVDLKKMLGDVQAATELSQKCMNKLIGSPLDAAKLDRLLRDTFGVTINDRAAIHEIQRRFVRCWKVLNKATFQYVADTSQMDASHIAEAVTTSKKELLVRISPEYLSKEDIYRSAMLIHEMIHHFNGFRADSHPGGIKPEGKLPLGIHPRHSVINPYCYQWFALYLVQPGFKSSNKIDLGPTTIRAKP